MLMMLELLSYFIRLKTVYYKSLCERLARLCYKNERLRRFEKSKKFPKMLFFGSWMAGSSEKKSSPTQAGTATEHKSFCVRPKRMPQFDRKALPGFQRSLLVENNLLTLDTRRIAAVCIQQ